MSEGTGVTANAQTLSSDLNSDTNTAGDGVGVWTESFSESHSDGVLVRDSSSLCGGSVSASVLSGGRMSPDRTVAAGLQLLLEGLGDLGIGVQRQPQVEPQPQPVTGLSREEVAALIEVRVRKVEAKIREEMEKREQKNRTEIMLEIRKELEEKEQRMNEKIKERETETCRLQETPRSNTAAGSGDRASKQSRKKNKRLSSQQTAAEIARVIEGGGVR